MRTEADIGPLAARIVMVFVKGVYKLSGRPAPPIPEVSYLMSRLLFTQKGNRVLAISLWGLLAGFVLVVKLFHIRLAGGVWECPFHKYFGFDCIGCGSTRALDALLALQPVEAFRYNPFFCLALAAGLIWLILFTRNAFSKKYHPPFSRQPTLLFLLILAGVLLLFMVVRNLPFYQQWFYV